MSTTENLIIPVILAGGKGTRLWPMSRTSRPKQFLPLTGDLSLFQQTLLRLKDPSRYAAPVIITSDTYRFLVAEQALECGVDLAGILLEPVARNTAAAIAAASVYVSQTNPDAIIHILASDHDINVDDAYRDAIDTARASAMAGQLVTFGITPSAPETGFGYVEAGERQTTGAHKVSRFVEKPDRARAEEMLAKGSFYWNSGMFMFGADVFLAECEALVPEIYEAATASVENAQKDLDFVRLDNESFARSPSISVDYAIFEKTKLAAVVPASIKWSDLGSWDAVWKSGARDKHDNLQRGPVSLSATKGSLVMSEKLHVAVDGLEDVAVIATEDAVFVGRLSAAQNVGAIVKTLGADPTTQALTETHQTSYRPWGGYTSVLVGERFQVKRLFVKPGMRLSLQKHHHRSEHWVVVRGTAEVQIGEKVMMLTENQSVYIPQGELHRLSNSGKILLELVEVQTGSYLGEDDIIRIEDEFGRD